MTPFDAAKYSSLLKGLAISEVRYRELEKTIRLDAEYYSPLQLRVEKQLGKCQTSPLISYLKCLADGNHMGISEEFCNEGIPYYRGGDVHTFFIENSRPEYCLPEDVYNRPMLRRSYLAKNDVLVTIVGTIGNVAIVTTDNRATCNYKLAIARPLNADESSYLAIYLKSSYGQNQINRIVRGSVQMGMLLDDLRELPIPKFTKRFIDKITDIVSCALSKDKRAKECMENAEHDLLHELGFEDWQPPIKTTAVRTYSDFVSVGRLEAEYFQPKYDELMKRLDALESRYLGGENGLTTFYKSVEPGSECYCGEGVPFIRISDFSEFGIENVGVHIPPEVCVDSRRLKKDTILFSKDGSVGIAYKVEEDLDMVTSSGILHLTVRDAAILPDYLTLVLNSGIVRLQAERDAGGSIIQHWRPSEIAKVVIPVLPRQKQEAIVAEVQSSFALRKESKRLLELARRAVEVAIEQGESVGMEVLDCE